MKSNLEEEIKNLNPSQQEAVNTIDGPVLVIAGPGTGKTQVLSYRIANILSKTDASAQNVLCLTFTDSGVNAMRNRLLHLIGNDALYVKIFTFHSFCNDVIQNNPERFNFKKELKQLDDLNKIKIIRQVIDQVALEGKSSLVTFNDKYYYQRSILDSIQTLKREGKKPDELRIICENALKELEANPELNKRTGKPLGRYTDKVNKYTKALELAEIYNLYSQALEQEGFYDYEDMILFVIDKLKTDDELLASLQEKYLYILVDEYQDTNGAQNEILRILGSFDSRPNIFAVGDDDQAIYRFQGANVENLLFFKKQFEDVKTISLITNYRSSQHILDLASKLVDNNQARLNKLIEGLNKNLKAALSIPNRPTEVFEFANQDAENKFIVNKIKELEANGVKYSDIAVFYKEHADGEDIAMDLINSNIPVRLAAGKNSLEQLAIIQLVNLLKVIDYTDKERDAIVFKIIFYPFFNITKLDCFRLTKTAHDKRISIFELMLNKPALQEAGIEEIEKINSIAEMLLEFKSDSVNHVFTQFIKKVMDLSGYLDYYLKNGNIEHVNSIQSFFEYVKSINLNNKELSLTDFLQDLKLLEENHISISESEISVNKEGVNLMTAHKSKGLEYKYVFIIKCVDKKWGNKKVSSLITLPDEIFDLTGEKDTEALKMDKLEDERRLFFVALTRAKEKLYISYAKEYFQGSSVKATVPSIFINELDNNLLEVNSNIENEFDANSVLSKLKYNTLSPYSVSEKQYLTEVISNFSLSASSLNKYIECPIKFKFEDLIKAPQSSNNNLILGTAIHYSLEQYARSQIKGNNKDLPFMLQTFLNYIDKQLIDPDDYKVIREEGLEILEKYYSFYNGEFDVPADVEYSFYNKNVLIDFEDGSIPLKLNGKIDRIEWINKDFGEVRVVDFKTSKPKSIKEIMGENKNATGDTFRQLVFYKLVGDLDKNFKPFNSLINYKITETKVQYLKPAANGDLKSETFVIEKPQIDELKEKIKDVITRIRNLEFGSDEYPTCQECTYCKLLKEIEVEDGNHASTAS